MSTINDSLLLSSFSQLVSALNATQGTNAKVALLQSPDYVHLRPLIARAFHPQSKTGLTEKGLRDYEGKRKEENSSSGRDAPSSSPPSLFDLFDQLISSDSPLRGHAAKQLVCDLAARHPDHRDLIFAIMSKQVRIRMSDKLILKCFPGIFSLWEVALAKEYKEGDKATIARIAKEGAFISRKVDGVRCLVVLAQDESITIYSRTGERFLGLECLLPDLKRIQLAMTPAEQQTGMVLDGEVVVADETGENFQKTVSFARRLQNGATIPGLSYYVFDWIRKDVFDGVTDAKTKLEERLARLKEATKKLSSIRPLSQTPYTLSSLNDLQARSVKSGWEGLMIRLNTPYEGGRTNALMKWKLFNSEEFRVVDVTIEDMPFPNASGGEDTLPALKNAIIALDVLGADFAGSQCSVGSGFSMEERLLYADHPELLVGKWMTVKYQDVTVNQQDPSARSLRFPIFMAVYEKKGKDRM